MLAYSPRHGRRFLGTVAGSWRQGLTKWADQLLETARLGAGKVEYLTDDAGAAGLCPRTGDRADDQDLLRRRMIALELDPHKLALSDPALLLHSAGAARCARTGKAAWRIWRCLRPIPPARARRTGATIVRTSRRSKCSWPCGAVRAPRRSGNSPMSAEAGLVPLHPRRLLLRLDANQSRRRCPVGR
jgi:hypothetical protein